MPYKHLLLKALLPDDAVETTHVSPRSKDPLHVGRITGHDLCKAAEEQHNNSERLGSSTPRHSNNAFLNKTKNAGINA